MNIPQCSGQVPTITSYPAPNVNGAKIENSGLGKGLCAHCTFSQPFYRLGILKTTKMVFKKKVRGKMCDRQVRK